MSSYEHGVMGQYGLILADYLHKSANLKIKWCLPVILLLASSIKTFNNNLTKQMIKIYHKVEGTENKTDNSNFG